MSRAAVAVLVFASAVRADPPRTDALGDPLPPGAVARLGSARLRHAESVHHVAFAPDGSRLAVTTDDGRVTVWDAATGRRVAEAEAGGRGAGVAFTASGKAVGTFAGGAGYRVFDADTGKLLRELPSELKVGSTPGGRQPAPVLAPGLRWMAYLTGTRERNDSRVVVVDPVSGRGVAAYPLLHHGWHARVTFSPDGSRLAIADGGPTESVLRVCDPAAGREVRVLPVESGHPTGVSLSRDGRRVAALITPYGDTTPAGVRVWDTASGQLLRTLPDRRATHESIALSPDGGRVAVTSREAAAPPDEYGMATVVRVIDLANGEVVRRHVTRLEYGRLFFSPDGTRVAVTSGNRVELFEPATGRVLPDPADVVEVVYDEAHAQRQAEFRPDGSLLLRGLRGGGVEVWNPATGRRTDVVPVPPGGRYVHALSADGRRVVFTAGHTIHDQERRLWDRDRKAELARVTHPGVVMPRFDYTADGRLFMHPQRAGPAAHDVWELDPATLRPLRTVELGRPFQNVPLWAGRAAGFGTRRIEFPIDGANETPTGVARQWDTAAGREGPEIRWAPEGATLRDGVGPVRRLRARAVSPNGRWLAVCQFVGVRGPERADGRTRDTGEDVVTVYDTADGREAARFVLPPEGHQLESRSLPTLAVSPDGRRVAVTTEGPACRVFDAATGAERSRLSTWDGAGQPGLYRQAHGPQFSPDGRFLLTACRAYGFVVWDARD